MANGSYIGKISALVTASTSDLSRKLRGAAQDVDRFGNSVRAQFDRASRNAENSLNQIFTPLQRLQRALTAGRSATLNILKPEDVRRLQQSVSLAEQINKPLASAARAFQNLSADAAGAFAPALVRAQEAAVQLSNTLAETGQVGTTQFNQAQRAVERTAEAIQRLNAVQRAANAGLTGNEAQFVNPRALAEISASAAASQRAGALPVSQREDPSLRERVRQLAQYRNQVVATAAQVEALELTPDVNQEALEAARRRLEQIIETSRRARQQLGEITASGQLNILSGGDLRSEAEARIRRREEDEARSRRLREEELEAEQGRRTQLLGLLAEQGRRRVGGLIGDINIDSTPRGPGGFSAQAQRDIDALATRVGAVRQQLETLPNSVRRRFIPELQRARDELIRLQNAPGAAVEEIERIRLSVSRLEAQARTAGQALNFRERFGAGAGGFERIFNTQALQGYTAQLDILQNILGTVSATARGPALVAFARLRDFIFQAFQAGTLGAEDTQREIAELTAEAVRATASVAGISAGGLQRQLTRAGDVGRRGLDRFSLAAQQAAFAIDDFFSVTGGLDQRIRAVGNNITQLGFIVGGTAGLFVTLGTVLIAQAVVGLVRFARGGAQAEDISKALNDRLEKQKNLLQEVNSEFTDLSGNLADGAFSQAAKQSEELERRLGSLIAKLKELRDSTASSLDPELFLLEGQRGTAERTLQSADSVALAAARQARLRDVEQRVADRREVAAQPRPISRQELERSINASFGSGVSGFRLGDSVDDRQILEVLERRQLELGKTVDSWFETFTAPFRQAEARRLILIASDAQRRLETDIAEAIREISEGTFSDSIRRFELSVNATSQALDAADEVSGPTDASRFLRGSQRSDARRLRSAVRRFQTAAADGRVDEARQAAALVARIADSAEARRRETRAIVDAANASERFISLLGRFGELNESIFTDVSNAAEQARRQAVQASATSEAGLSSPQDAANARARSERLQRELGGAQDRRLRIEAQVEEFRRRFEQESPDPAIRRLVFEAAQARSIAESETASDAARATARRQLIFAENQLQRGFEDSVIGRELQSQLDSADQQARVALERDSLISRGRELSLTEGQRAGQELGESLRAINEDFNDRTERLLNQDPFADLGAIEAERREAQQRLVDQSLRQTAPAIFGLADQVANAVLQGPSRAALTATDVSSVQGSAELNRLLRGDDPARNQDLVQLQRQSVELQRELVRLARDGGPQVANN